MELIKSNIARSISSSVLVGVLFLTTYASAQSPRHPELRFRRQTNGSLALGGRGPVVDLCNGNDHQPRAGGSAFEIFQTQNSGRDACMTVHRNPSRRGNLRNDYIFGEWSEIDNALIRESQRPSDTNRNMSYFIDINSSNNVYHGGYGWWSRNGQGRQDIVEFYVVEGWNDRRDPIFGMDYVRSYSSGGNMYDLYVHRNITAGSVFGTRTFTQIKCVRQGVTRRANRERGGDNSGFVGNGRFSGEIIWETHFRQMQRAGYTPQDIFEISYTVEGFGRDSRARFLLNASFRSTNRRFNFKTLDAGLDAVAVTENSEVSVSPNPTSGQFVVNSNEGNDTTVQVFDINGALLEEIQSDSATIEMNLGSNLAPGLYIVKTATSGSTTTHKLVVR